MEPAAVQQEVAQQNAYETEVQVEVEDEVYEDVSEVEVSEIEDDEEEEVSQMGVPPSTPDASDMEVPCGPPSLNPPLTRSEQRMRKMRQTLHIDMKGCSTGRRHGYETRSSKRARRRTKLTKG